MSEAEEVHGVCESEGEGRGGVWGLGILRR